MNLLKHFKLLSFTIVVATLVSIINSCSTEKDAAINKGYHNMNARYNGYFNAGEIIDASLTSFRESKKDDYTKLLELEKYPVGDEASALFPDMDDAIERCSKVIYKHAMPNPNVVKSKNEEHCRWIDDNWLLIGKAHYIKGEHTEAIEKFKYIIKSYKGEEAIYAARIWLAKTYIVQKQYSKAKIELNKVTDDIKTANANKKSFSDLFKKDEDTKKMSRSQKKRARKKAKKNKKVEPAKFSKKLKVEYEVTFAELHIQQKEYDKAIPHIEEAIKLTKDKKEKSRLMFVLAQLYKKDGQGSQAEFYFNKVAKSNASYEMRFYAKINAALSSTSGGENLRKDLRKMLKDAKNEEYKDQIYYVLAEMDLKDGNVASAKTNLSRSVFYSVNNDRQKGVSYLKLADLHFEEKDYIPAQKYYDSCVTVMPETYENYKQIKSKAEGLSRLVENYEIVVVQDSLQMVAQLPEKEREKFLKNTVKQIKEEEIRKKIEEEQRLIDQQKRIASTAASSGAGSKWYFYNQKAVGSGFNTFRATWGQRTLEDDWRRSNKESISDVEELETDTTQSEDKGLTVDDLMVNLPLTPEAIDSSNNMIMESLYNLGIIYKEQLKEEKEAISYFNQVLDRRIEHEKVLPSTYQLYLIYKKKGDSKADKYKNIILSNYPDSEIAQLVLDPEYLKKKEESNRLELDAYSSVLKDYQYRNYMVVISKCTQVINNEPNNKYINKYYLLKAFAISKSNFGGVEAVITPLQQLYEISPESEEGILAKSYLDKISKGESITPVDNSNKINYNYNESSKHYFVLIFPNDKGDINPVKINISNFNTSYFGNDGLSLKNGIVGKDNQTIQIKTFDNSSKAMTYYRAFVAPTSKPTLGDLQTEFQFFVISQQNYILFYKNIDIEGYLEFFNKNY
jgi:tetratricopeptide (TPR) repeat protein